MSTVRQNKAGKRIARRRRHGSEYHCHYPFKPPLMACEIAIKAALECAQIKSMSHFAYILPTIFPWENVELSPVLLHTVGRAEMHSVSQTCCKRETYIMTR